jgi:hypothetical protein
MLRPSREELPVALSLREFLRLEMRLRSDPVLLERMLKLVKSLGHKYTLKLLRSRLMKTTFYMLYQVVSSELVSKSILSLQGLTD